MVWNASVQTSAVHVARSITSRAVIQCESAKMRKMTTHSMQNRHSYTIGTLDVLQACDTCADMGMTYSVIVQHTNCVVFLQNTPISRVRVRIWVRFRGARSSLAPPPEIEYPALQTHRAHAFTLFMSFLSRMKQQMSANSDIIVI